MFKLRSGKNAQDSPSGWTGLQVDMHAHLLPGIDDGPDTVEEALELIRGLAELGYKKLIATPHVMAGMYPNTPERIKEAFQQINPLLKEEKIPVSLSYSAEYFLDEQFSFLLEENTLLPFSDNFLLVEMSTFSPSPKYHEYLFNLRTKNYRPILAHPERYSYFENDLETFEKIKNMGCLFQVNLLSLTGYYGKKVRQCAMMLLENNMVDFLGTDLHHTQHLKKLKKNLHPSKLPTLLSEYQFMNNQL